jgi:hypothetical protein
MTSITHYGGPCAPLTKCCFAAFYEQKSNGAAKRGKVIDMM